MNNHYDKINKNYTATYTHTPCSYETISVYFLCSIWKFLIVTGKMITIVIPLIRSFVQFYFEINSFGLTRTHFIE